MHADRELAAELPLLVADVYEAAGALRRHGDRIAALAGQTQARWQVLSVLSEGDWTVPRAARRLGVTRQAVQRTVDVLQADGLVTIKANPDHRRSPLVRLTDSGHAALTAITAAADQWLAELALLVGLDEVTGARSLLRVLIEAA